MKQETTLPVELHKSQAIIAKYGNLESAIARLAPTTIQNAIYKHSIKSNKQAFLTDSITLAKFSTAYSKDGCLALLELWLYELSEFVGVNGKITQLQVQQLANMIYSEAYFLNFAEFGLFFTRIKKGCYGEFYGNVDPIKIMTFLEQYLTERAKSIEELNKENDQEKKRVDFQSYLNTKLSDEQRMEITEIMNNFIKQVKR